MNLAELLVQLRSLTQNPTANWTRIATLLESHAFMAEVEVARHVVARAVEPEVQRLAASEDPRERHAASTMVREAFSRSAAAQVLRGLVKDPDMRTRAHARGTIRKLGIEDVALPDTRIRRPAWYRRSDWNPSGWVMGRLLGRHQRIAPAQLAPANERANLPDLADPDALAQLVGYADASELVRFMRPGSATGSPYVDFDVPKATGGTRTISAPRPKLRAIQRTILERILDHCPVHDAAHGFVKGRSTVTGARPHLGAKIVIKTDLVEFFPSVHYRRVVGLFTHYGYSDEVAKCLAGLTTRRPILGDGTLAWPGVLPQGAPTSPAIANLVCRRLDARLSGLCAKAGATYTRYADDLTFSFQAEPDKGIGRFLWWVDQICQQEGFREHPRKRRVLRPGAQQRITGIVINSGRTRVPRKARRRFRAILHNCKTQGIDSQARGQTAFRDVLRGYAAYVHMVEPAVGRALMDEVEDLIRADPGP